jgi:hypothetical protein
MRMESYKIWCSGLASELPLYSLSPLADRLKDFMHPPKIAL